MIASWVRPSSRSSVPRTRCTYGYVEIPGRSSASRSARPSAGPAEHATARRARDPARLVTTGQIGAGGAFSRFHAEAGIAAEHCLAPSLAATRWDRIVECYALLERHAPSALHTLNRAVALAQWRGPAEGLALLESIKAPSWLEGSHLWAAVLADLHRRLGHVADAERHGNLAIETAPSAPIRELLRRRQQSGA